MATSTMAATYYVSLTGSDTPPYNSWATASTTIQAAVDAASDGDTVKVYEGTYNLGHTATPGYSSLNRVVITKDISVQSWGLTENTIIAGNNIRLGRDDVLVRCVYMTQGELVGFTLKHGRANGVDGNEIYDQCGGAVFAASDSVKVTSCIFTDSTAVNKGGGSYGIGLFTDCTFSSNVATNYGGGCYLGTLTNCTFTGNSAKNGGGSAYATLIDSTLTDNQASSLGGGTYYGEASNCTLSSNTSLVAGGGSSQATLSDCTLSFNDALSGGASHYGSLTRCILSENTATSGGGNFHGDLIDCSLIKNSASYGGGSYYGDLIDCSLTGNTAASEGGGSHNGTLTGCTLSGNSAQEGGGARSSTLVDCTLSENTAIKGGGSAWSTLTKCFITKNEATDKGGGSYNSILDRCSVSDNTAQQEGGGIHGYVTVGSSSATNCVLTGNTATSGGGTYGNVFLHNCTIKDNEATNDGGGCHGGRLFNCIVVDNQAGNNNNDLYNVDLASASCSPDLTQGHYSCITNKPKFADLQLHLRPDSPCIDHGVQQGPIGLDLDDLFRPLDGDGDGTAHLDMGAYEFAGIGDLDNDGLSDAEEVALGSDLNNDDTDNDGRTDGDEVAIGFSPTYNESAAIAQGEANVTDDPAAHNLYTPDSIQDLNMGAVMVQAEGNTLHLSLQMKQTTNLASNVWNNAGELVEWQLPATNNAAFFRVHAQ
jgi:hypothetical protein